MENSTNQEIFKVISEHVQDNEFTSAQNCFFDKHKEVFEENEENKLEYT
jgi:hypothetical protein